MKSIKFLCAFFMIGVLASCASDDDSEVMSDNVSSGELAASVNGASFDAEASKTFARMDSNVLTITAEDTNGDTISITLTPFTGEGAYDLSGFTSEGTAIYLPDGENQFYNSGNEGGSGTITLLNVNSSGGTVSGNFSFTAIRNNSNSANETVQVSNGVFTNVSTTGL